MNVVYGKKISCLSFDMNQIIFLKQDYSTRGSKYAAQAESKEQTSNTYQTSKRNLQQTRQQHYSNREN